MSESEAKFDPGFAELVVPFEPNISACNEVIGQIKSFHQKKFKFQMLYPQMLKLIENNVAFYFGCLLWAYYLLNNYKSDPTEITGNTFLDLDNKAFEEYDMAYDVNYLANYLPKFENDTKYFLGKQVEISQKWKMILEQYKEFVALNNGFRNVKMTSDIIIPANFVSQLSLNEIKTEINLAIKAKTIEYLLKL